jgi:hypothetical protein
MTDDPAHAQASSTTPQSNPVLQPLAAFVGEWQREAWVGGQSIGRGRTVFDWLEGGAFLGEHSDAENPEFPASTAIIGGDDSTETYCMFLYDSRVVSRIYQMSLSGGVWKLWRDAPGFWQRFTGTFSDDGQTLRGRWEKSGDGSTWEHDFDLTYTKAR